MLHGNAVKLTEFLFSKCPIEAVKRPIFVYGFKLLPLLKKLGILKKCDKIKRYGTY